MPKKVRSSLTGYGLSSEQKMSSVSQAEVRIFGTVISTYTRIIPDHC